MSVTNWSTDPAQNQFLRTINLQEGATQVADVNDAFRVMMADIKIAFNGVPVAANYVTRAGGSFTGVEPIYQGRGAYSHWVNAGLTSGAEYLQPDSAPVPVGAAPGTKIFGY
jgi:hypothetical protein